MAERTRQKPFDKKALEKLIRFHEDGLLTHRYKMSPSAVYLTERTIAQLKLSRALTPDAEDAGGAR